MKSPAWRDLGQRNSIANRRGQRASDVTEVPGRLKEEQGAGEWGQGSSVYGTQVIKALLKTDLLASSCYLTWARVNNMERHYESKQRDGRLDGVIVYDTASILMNFDKFCIYCYFLKAFGISWAKESK